ncbi:MAG: bifunctional phosphoribosylaminoimidazolecarboxamide formyltransferase/IMP cyclohydrolase PurH [Cytophagales bacterium]|nr:MAG: bifunctional phosphoribosylaminoimidazolecarboxamide formyltransferase/IMP cyclohydrolase PurH [Cytophagales bacterium]
MKKISTVLISVFDKEGLAPLVEYFHQNNITLYSTGGTQQYIEQLGIPVVAVESLTSYPSILGGRVKTLHPKIFGGILFRREDAQDRQEVAQYEIPAIDLVIVDLYPFEKTVATSNEEQTIIEKIDIGGVSLIRAAAKNFKDVAIVASQKQYHWLLNTLQQQNNELSLENRKNLATEAFSITAHYDTAIFQYFNTQTHTSEALAYHFDTHTTLRYGENPHQKGLFYGNLSEIFEQLHGKELSYNNLVDVNDAVALIEDFEQKTAFAIIKHTNACGIAIAQTPKEAYLKALQADPVSAFGGVIATNSPIDLEVAQELNQLFFEVLIAPAYSPEALTCLQEKKNRILLVQKKALPTTLQVKSILNGMLVQDKDLKVETVADLKTVTERTPTEEEITGLLFALKVVKHTKSNTIVLAKGNQLLASGTGQTSRVDALKQALEKAKNFGFDVQGAVMASDAFFPFPDCVEIAHQAGITAVVQPGGSIKDQASIDYCNQAKMAMVFTGFRHFKH